MKKNGSKGARNGGETSKYNFLQGVRSQRNGEARLNAAATATP